MTLTSGDNTAIAKDETHPLLSIPREEPTAVDDRNENDIVVSTSRTEKTGYLLMLMAALALGAHSTLVRAAGNVYNVPATTTLFMRGSIHLTLSIIYFLWTYPITELFRPALTLRQYFLLTCRGICGTTSLLTFYTAVSNFIPIGDAVSIFKIVPAFTLLLSRLFLSEPITFYDIIALIFSSSGATIIAYSKSPSSSSSSSSSDFNDANNHFNGAIMVVFAAFLASIAYTIVRGLGMSISFMSSIFSFALFCTIGSFLLSGRSSTISFLFNIVHSENNFGLEVLAITISLGFASFIGQCGLSLGLQRCRAGPGTLITNVQVPMTFVLGAVFLHEIPGHLTILGSVLIIISALIIGLKKIR